MYERFTDRARQVMQLANKEAQRFNHEYIGTEHILLGLVKEGSGVAANVLKNLDIDLRKIRLEVEKIVQTGPGGEQVAAGKLPHTPRSKKVIEYSVEEARNLNHNYIGTEHLLLGLLREQEGVGAQVLINLGLRLDEVRQEVLGLLGHNLSDRPAGAYATGRSLGGADAETPFLNAFGRVLPEPAPHGQGPLLRRPDVVRRLALAAGRLTKTPILLIDETVTRYPSVIEEFAASMTPAVAAAGHGWSHVVELDVKLLAVDMLDSPRSCAGKIRQILSEAAQANVVLCIDSFDVILEAGRAHPFTLLQPGPLGPQCLIVGRTTPDSYRRACRRLPGLEGRFEVIPIEPLTSDEVVELLQALRQRYEAHHNAQLTDAAIRASVDRCRQQTVPGALLDRSLLLIDTACAWVRLKPNAEWRDRTKQQMESQIATLNLEKESAVAEQQFDRAAQLRDQADQLKRELEGVLKAWRAILQERCVVDEAAVDEAFGQMNPGASPS